MPWNICPICKEYLKDGQNLYELRECHYYAGKRFIHTETEDLHQFVHQNCLKERCEL